MRGDDGHQQFESMAVAHVLGGLDSDEGRIFRSHLLECPLCRARVGELRAIASDLAGVERDERRERSAKAVETKRRAEAEAETEHEAAQPWVAPRWLLVTLALALVALGSAFLVQRGNLQRVEDELEERLRESAALEHGEDLEVRHLAPDVDATAKVHGDHVVVLLEGLQDGRSYGFYLLGGQGGAVLDRGPLRSEQGRLLRRLPLPPGADRLLITAPEGEWATEPEGERILEVRVHEPAAQPASIGSA